MQTVSIPQIQSFRFLLHLLRSWKKWLPKSPESFTSTITSASTGSLIASLCGCANAQNLETSDLEGTSYKRCPLSIHCKVTRTVNISGFLQLVSSNP